MSKQRDTKQICRAVEILGGTKAAAVALGVQQALVWQWEKGVRPVPARFCLPIESATAGKVTRHDLMPQVFGPAPKVARRQKAAA